MLKAYQCDDRDVYAANDAQEAKRLWHETVGEDEEMDDEFPHELPPEALLIRYPAFDENERPIEGQTISVAEMLVEHGDTPGWLCGSDW
jgi:hypothetical protein